MSSSAPARAEAGGALWVAVTAWLITSIYYFFQYVLRSAPAVMMSQMTEAFGLSAAAMASLVGSFYYGYAAFSLIGGVALDQFGARKTVTTGAAMVALGALLFATGDPSLATVGRILQGCGGAFALLSAVYVVSTNFPPSRAGTLIGATQMFGSGGGSAGQFLVGPAIAAGLLWSQFWLIMGAVGVAITALLYLLIPPHAVTAKPGGGHGLKQAATALLAVFRNRQSILCGLIAGLMFVPTTIFDMIWGVHFLQEGHDMPYAMAVMRSASVPFGWIIGAPLLGWLSDRIGRRKPVIIGSCAVLLASLFAILYGPAGTFPAFSLGLISGIASGGSMLTFAVVKELNAPELSGTATGVNNFINFGCTALLGPVFASLLERASGNGERELVHYQTAFAPLLFGIALAIILTLFLRETGAAAKKPQTA
jgi:MFS family permease